MFERYDSVTAVLTEIVMACFDHLLHKSHVTDFFRDVGYICSIHNDIVGHLATF